MKKLKAYLFPSIMLFTSLAMAAIAAYISVSGLGKLFAGAGAIVLLMTGIIEFSKVVITTHLHNSGYKKDNWLINIPLTIITVIIMGVTSLGVYGFLANGYTVTSGELDKNKGQIELVENKIKNHRTKIEGLKEQKTNYNDRSKKLTDLRTQQETRVDSLYARRWYNSARKVENQIKEANIEIKSLMKKSANADSLIQVENEAIGELKNKIIDLNNSEVNAELGPLKYIADLTGLPMDNVINYIILVLIFIFDPAAVLLLIAANKALEKAKEEVNKPEPEKFTVPIVVDEEIEEDIDQEFNELAELAVETESEPEETTEVEEVVEEPVEEIVEEDVENEGYPELEEEKSTFVTDGDEKLLVTGLTAPTEVSEKAERFFEEKEKGREQFKELVLQKNQELAPDSIAKDTLYLKLLKVLYKNGEINKGDSLPSFEEFEKDLNEQGIKCSEKTLRDFLAGCNLIHVIDTSKGKRQALKSFEEARDIIKHI